jgi:hypothetical protein
MNASNIFYRLKLTMKCQSNEFLFAVAHVREKEFLGTPPPIEFLYMPQNISVSQSVTRLTKRSSIFISSGGLQFTKLFFWERSDPLNSE